LWYLSTPERRAHVRFSRLHRVVDVEGALEDTEASLRPLCEAAAAQFRRGVAGSSICEAREEKPPATATWDPTGVRTTSAGAPSASSSLVIEATGRAKKIVGTARMEKATLCSTTAASVEDFIISTSTDNPTRRHVPARARTSRSGSRAHRLSKPDFILIRLGIQAGDQDPTTSSCAEMGRRLSVPFPRRTVI